MIQNTSTTSSNNSISNDINTEDFNRATNLNMKPSELNHNRKVQLDKQSIYSDKASRFKINETQFEALFPFLPQLDTHLNAFASFDRKEIIVEFGTYVNFIVSNLTEPKINERKPKEKIKIFERKEEEYKALKANSEEEPELKEHKIIFGSDILYNYAHKTKEILDAIRNMIYTESSKVGRNITIDEAHTKLTPQIKERIRRLVSANPKILTELWESFLINVAILNIKSVILCGEYISNKLDVAGKQVIPLKFIPKLGSELSVISKQEILTLNEVKSKLITSDLGEEYNHKLLINSLVSEEVNDIFNYNLDGKNIYIPEIAEEFGYTQDRYSNAEESIIKSASNSTVALSECNNYLDSLVDYIDSLGALYSELKFINEKDKCVVLDFDWEKF